MPLRVSSGFGPRVHPVTGEADVHRGIDLPLPLGWPILAARGGRVVRVDAAGVGRGTVNGNAVHVRDPFGLTWHYLHLSQVEVQPGEVVATGELVGRAGSTGRSTGNHLHFAVDRGGEYLNPIGFYPPGTFY